MNILLQSSLWKYFFDDDEHTPGIYAALGSKAKINSVDVPNHMLSSSTGLKMTSLCNVPRSDWKVLYSDRNDYARWELG